MELNEIIKKAKSTIPSVDTIIEEAISNLGIDKLSKKELLTNFEEFVKKVEAGAFKIYLEYEERAFKVLESFYEKGVIDLHDFTRAVRRLEFISGQMRKARGGSSFQKIIRRLLNLSGVPCEEPHSELRQILKKVDLVAPDGETAKNTPDKAIFLAVKRTLRERWKQVVPEQMKGARLYIVTINGTCSEGKAKEIRETGMVAYVPEELKQQSHLRNKPWIRPLSRLPRDIKNGIPKETS